MKHAIITICLIVLASAACACGAELLVPGQFPTIQLAVNAAVPGDTVILADGTYTGPGNTNITISKAITVRSQNGPENCIIDCNNTIGFLTKAGTLAGITITKGRGAFSCSEGKFTLTNCILTGNKGAVICASGSLKIFNCSLFNNTPYITTVGGGFPPYDQCGGAIYCDNGSVLIVNSNISGNSALAGGGILCVENSSMTIKNCVISDNNAKDNTFKMGGGGIFCEQSSMVIIGTEISRNSSSLGAGIYCNEASSVFISDCNIHHNVYESMHMSTSGGGIYYKAITQPINGKSLSILNTSITDNIIKGYDCKGAGLYIETPMSPVSNPQNLNIILSGCVVTRNTAITIPEQGYISGHSYGGGLYCKGAVLMTETEVLNNSAFRGGGIYNEGLSLTMSRCRISGNFSNDIGEAIYSNTGEIVLESCCISGNRGQEGNAIWCYPSTILKMANCTVVGNSFPAIYVYPTNPSPSITNSIIYGNCFYPYQSCKDQISPRTVSISYSNIQGGYTGTGNINADPCFVQPGYWNTNGTPDPRDDFWVEGDYRLTAVSPCIDTGGVAFLMDNKDLAGNPRFTGASLDMGAYEYQNSMPTAEAGPEQVVFAWIDGIATVTLDGSASHDADGDELSYLWSWSIDGNNFEANGVNPAIELPVGQHRIELIVNDGLVDSRPDDVNVMVIGPIEARMWTVPCVINRQSWQPYILAMLKLPEGITMEQIDSNDKLLLYPGGIEPIKQRITQVSNGRHQQIAITAFFDKASLLAGINGTGPVHLNLVGQLTSGQYFFGQDKIWVINPRPEPKLNLLIK